MACNKQIIEEIFGVNDQAFVVLDANQSILVWSEGAENLFGIDRDLALGKIFDELVCNADYKSKIHGKFLDILSGKSHSGFRDEFITLSNSDDAFACEVTAQRIKNDKNLKLLCFCNKLDSLTAASTESENETIQRLEKLNSSKDRFFSIIAHDLKGPFQTLLGYTKILHDDFDMLEQEDVKELSVSLNSTAEILYKLLENLLEWTRIQRGHISYNPDKTNIADLAKFNLELISPRANYKKITLDNQVKEDVLCWADANMINTVLRNLLSNSVKFTDSGKSIGITCDKKDDEFVIITVFDTGVGMPESVREKLFKIGEKHTSVGTDNESGTGLGLVLCRELVEKNLGEIWVESELGKGSRFSFTVPCYNNQDNGEG